MKNTTLFSSLAFFIFCFSFVGLKAPEVCEIPQDENKDQPLQMTFFPEVQKGYIKALYEEQLPATIKYERFLVESLITRDNPIGSTFFFRNKSWTVENIEKQHDRHILIISPEFNDSKDLKIVYSPTSFNVEEIERVESQASPTWQQQYYPWIRKALIAVGLIALYNLYYSFQNGQAK